MDNSFPEKSDLIFPHIKVLKASAGSGKTHALTLRYVEFLMNSAVPRNDLRNILAITFRTTRQRR